MKTGFNNPKVIQLCFLQQVFGKLALMTLEQKEQHWVYRYGSLLAPDFAISALCFALLVLCNMLM